VGDFVLQPFNYERQGIMAAKLSLLKPDGTTLTLTWADKPLVAGRSQMADVFVSDPGVSRRHCDIRFEKGEWILTHLGSVNGTTVNGQPANSIRLHQGDSIQIGNATFQVMLKTPKGMSTVIREVEQDLQRGKGPSTLIRKAVREAERRQAAE
jgi:pSer/pThr/pTyr-binding forkhead associated (FHA) protein